MIYKGINFNGTHYQYGSEQVWCNFDNSAGAKLFLAERYVICIEYTGQGDLYIGPNIETRIATYSRDENNRVIIDLTDWIRTHYKDGSLYDPRICVYTEDDDIFELLDSVGGVFLRDPWKVPIPKSSIQGLLITPPSRMLTCPYGVIPIDTSFIWNDKGFETSIWQYRPITTSVWIDAPIGTPFMLGSVGVEIGTNGLVEGRFEPKKVECGVRYAVIQWRSFVGPYKAHTFKINSQKTDTQDNYSLLMVDNSYNEIKGSEESLIFSIDELNTYDFWYYSDILTSSEVSLMVCDGKVFYEISQTKEAVGGIRLEITTKNVTIPSGERADGKLEFEAKIKRYDAVTL